MARAKKPAAKKAAKKSAKKPAKKPAKKLKAKPPVAKPAKPSKELEAYLRAWKEYPITEVRAARCICGGAVFEVIDAGDDGGAKRICIACEREHLICDSAEYWDDDADLEECACPCGRESFELAAGFAFYAESIDVRWIYLGLRCVACKKSGVYVDWKIDYSPSQQLLDQV